jgi:hypothetical protein
MVNDALDPPPDRPQAIQLVELHQPMTAKMKAIQRAILTLMDTCLRELFRAHPAVRFVTCISSR